MSATRRSSRITKKSCISVKLSVSDGVELVDANGFVENMDEESKWTAEIVDDEDDGDEELIENPDGTMSIKMANKSKDISRLECEKCGLSFPTNEALIRHENICRHMPFDEIAYRDEEDYANVDVYHKKYDRICFCCNEDLATAHYGHVKCNFCPKSFKSHSNLERHLFLLHSAATEYTCEYCNATCSSPSVLDVHTAQHKSSGKPFSCQRCGKDFTRKYHLDRHLQYTDCDASKPKQEVPCHVCGKLFTRTDNLREHLRAHIGQSSRKRDYQCPHCEKSFYGSSLLNIHIRTHTGEKPFPCDLCDKSFPSNGALRKHRRSHTGEKPYACKMCDGRFSAKETLNRHVKVHTGERPHKCTYCPKSFIQSTQLKAHLFHHTGENAYTCSYCGDQFGRKNRLDSHIKSMHLNPSPVTCDICNKQFRSKNMLKKHLSEHNERKKYHCEACARLFSSKQSLQIHQKRLHDEITAEHKCKICRKTYGGMDAIMRHMSKMHKETFAGVIEKAEKKKAKNITINNVNAGKKTKNVDVIVNAEIGDIVNIEHIELINTDSQAPDTYKIICGGETESQDAVFEIYEMDGSNTMKIEELPTIPETTEEKSTIFLDDEELQKRVAELLKIVVDEDVLTKFGYPAVDTDTVLTSVLQECEQKPVDVATCPDIGTKIRENVKLLFTTVIGDESIRDMLNNHTVDEVINYVITLAEA